MARWPTELSSGSAKGYCLNSIANSHNKSQGIFALAFVYRQLSEIKL